MALQLESLKETLILLEQRIDDLMTRSDFKTDQINEITNPVNLEINNSNK